MTSPIWVFDFTISDEGWSEELINRIKKLSKKWGYQKEIGEKSGYVHWQGRISLHDKLRLSTIIKQIPIKGKWTPTSKECSTGDRFYEYTTKEDTRVEGPWTDKEEQKFIPRQIREIETLLPWQNSVIEKIKQWDTRHIDVLVDMEGCRGKSILAGYAHCHGLGRRVPSLNNYKDLMGMLMCMPTSKAYFIDMPKAIDKNSLGEFYAAMETLKDGYLFDTRYVFKEKWIDSPNIWVFTNQSINRTLLSKDRWRIWMISDNDELIGGLSGASL